MSGARARGSEGVVGIRPDPPTAQVLRAFAVVNPAAGGGRSRRILGRLRDRLQRSALEIDDAETTGPGTATALTRQAVADGWPVVIAVGGDGTVNEVVDYEGYH